MKKMTLHIIDPRNRFSDTLEQLWEHERCLLKYVIH